MLRLPMGLFLLEAVAAHRRPKYLSSSERQKFGTRSQEQIDMTDWHPQKSKFEITEG